MVAFLCNRAPNSTTSMQSPFKMLSGTEPDLRLLQVIGARAFVHIETYTKKLELKAVEGHLVGYSSNSKSCHVYNPAIRRIMESRNVIFIRTPSRLLLPFSEETPSQSSPWRHRRPEFTAQEEFVTAALTMKEAVLLWGRSWESARALTAYCCASITPWLCTSPEIGPTVRIKHVALRYSFVQELMKEGRISIHDIFNIPTSYQQWVWEREAHIIWSLVTCEDSTRSELP